MEIHKLAENLGLDEASYRGLLELFVQQSRKDLKRVRAALAASDGAAAAEAAHSLRGAAGNLDLGKISRLAGVLEAGARGGSLDNAGGQIEELAARLETLAAAIAPRAE